ncbi:putative copper resistance protein D [Paraburkholderia sp. BL23I1N1]|uniref:CopD family protein n=1 Tax=Paraburkholderia sp. BL23I1N1 TaxID=1938802 RepID=UPI000E74B978|nr:CopD family protein [Paraburkholderia sp. BL23I1N1]RKE37877.1 putative copper resistance protein D [Paraburkholderia sp. BL23I1N1]
MDPLVVAQIALAAMQDILFAVATGALACGVLGARSGLPGQDTTRVWRTVASVALALTALAYLWLQAAIMSGSPLGEAGSAITPVLTQSHFGKAWSIGLAGALLAALSGLKKERGSALFAAGFVLWVASKAAASHAADSGDFSWREAIHVVHLSATALWAGSVIVAAILSRGLGREPSRPPGQRAAFCSALSHLATAALVFVLVTGFYNAVQDTAQASAPLLRTHWGRLLAAKLACVVLVTLLGGWNRMAILPDLLVLAERNDPDSPAAQRRFDGVLSVEALVMLAVLALAAVLGHMSPTGG